MLDSRGVDAESIEFLNVRRRRTVLPAEWTDYFTRRGLLSQHFEERRRYPRYYYRGVVVFELRRSTSEVITKDLSRNGVGFYHFAQLYPCEEAQIWLPGEGRLNIRISRCQRVQTDCYACGAQFVLESDREAAWRQIEKTLAELAGE